MVADTLQKYRFFALPPTPRRVRRPRPLTTEERALDRRMHDLFVRMATPLGTVPSEAIQKIREHEQRPWRVGARRILEAADAEVPIDLAREFARAWGWFIDLVYAKHAAHGTRTAHKDNAHRG